MFGRNAKTGFNLSYSGWCGEAAGTWGGGSWGHGEQGETGSDVANILIFFLISPILTFTSNLKTSRNSFAILLYILSALSVDFVFHIFCVRACLFGFVRFPYATREVVGSETGTYIC